MNTLFTAQDIPFMMEQAKSLPDFIFKQELIGGNRAIPLDTLKSSKQLSKSFWRQLKDRYGIDEFLTISKPFFQKINQKPLLPSIITVRVEEMAKRQYIARKTGPGNIQKC